MEQQIVTLQEKMKKINELDVMKKTLEKVSLEHTADRTQISSSLKDAICKEKTRWNEDLLELKVCLKIIISICNRFILFIDSKN